MHRFANPGRFMRIANAVLPWTAGGTALSIGLGLYLALFVAPPDYQQGESVRIMYVHVPSAWMALFIYTVVAVGSLSSGAFIHFLGWNWVNIGAMPMLLLAVLVTLWHAAAKSKAPTP